MMTPPIPEPINCSEKAKDGTARGQPNSSETSFSATTIRYMPPALTISIITEPDSTMIRRRASVLSSVLSVILRSEYA